MNCLDVATKQDIKEDHKIWRRSHPHPRRSNLHITDSELNQFLDIEEDPKEEPIKEDCTNIKENRRVFLNNNWQVKDSIRNPAFQGIIEEDPNIDWLTFISENINY